MIDYEKLSDPEKRIKVAKFHTGADWTFHPATSCWKRNGIAQSNVGYPLLNYLNDLNACHAMEKVMTDEQYAEYSELLGSGLTGAHHGITDKSAATFADARCRCKAFIIIMEKI
jgi:hypothetical protein